MDEGALAIERGNIRLSLDPYSLFGTWEALDDKASFPVK